MQVRQLLTSSRYLHLGEKSTAPKDADFFRSATPFFFGGIWTGSLRVNLLFLQISLKVLGELLFSPIVRSQNLNIYTTLNFYHLMK